MISGFHEIWHYLENPWNPWKPKNKNLTKHCGSSLGWGKGVLLAQRDARKMATTPHPSLLIACEGYLPCGPAALHQLAKGMAAWSTALAANQPRGVGLHNRQPTQPISSEGQGLQAPQSFRDMGGGHCDPPKTWLLGPAFCLWNQGAAPAY